MSTRWFAPLTAPLKYWWINDFSAALAGHPFGTVITEETVKTDLCPAFTQWEDKYRQLILLGKQLPALPDALKTAEIEIAGCENRVWLGHQQRADGTLHFFGDSEGRIVRGLLAVLLTAVEGKTPAAELLATFAAGVI